MTAVSPYPGHIALYSEPLDPGEIQTYGVAEVARMLGVGVQTVRDHVRLSGAITAGDRQIPVIKVCNRYRFPKAAVHAALSAD